MKGWLGLQCINDLRLAIGDAIACKFDKLVGEQFTEKGV